MLLCFVCAAGFHGWVGCRLTNGVWRWLSNDIYTPASVPQKATKCSVFIQGDLVEMRLMSETETLTEFVCELT